MNEIKNLKEKQINDFIYDIDINNATVSEIKGGLKYILGEEPGVQFNYKKDVLVNEKTGEKTRNSDELESIEIYFTFIGEQDTTRFGFLKYII